MKKNPAHSRKQSGFTLIEILLVILIILILAIVVLVALRPAQRLRDARDARRGQDLNQLLTGIHQCIIDDDDSSVTDCVGTYVAGETYEIVANGVTTGCDDVCTGVTSDTHCLDLETTLSEYFFTLPSDPGGVATGHTEYTITVNSNGLVRLDACSAEGGTIAVAR